MEREIRRLQDLALLIEHQLELVLDRRASDRGRGSEAHEAARLQTARDDRRGVCVRARRPVDAVPWSITSAPAASCLTRLMPTFTLVSPGEETQGKHKDAIASLLTLIFQIFGYPEFQPRTVYHPRLRMESLPDIPRRRPTKASSGCTA